MAVAGGPTNYSDYAALASASTTKPLVRLVQQIAQSPSSGVGLALTFTAGSEDIDTHGYHDTSTNTSRVTPQLAGYYRVTVTASMASPSVAYTQIVAAVGKNGVRTNPQRISRPDAASIAAANAQTSTVVSLNGSTDYVEGFVVQTSSGTQPTNVAAGNQSMLEVEFLRPL